MGCASSRARVQVQEPPPSAARSAAEDGSSCLVDDGGPHDSAAPQQQLQPPAEPSPANSGSGLASSGSGSAAAGLLNQPDTAPEPQGSEEERLEVVAALQRSQPEDRFGAVTGLLTTFFEVPLAFVSLLGEHDVTSYVHDSSTFTAPRGAALCEWPMQLPHKVLLVVDDLASDPKRKDASSVVGQPRLRFYAATPLRCSSGTLGTLCIADRQPRTFSAEKYEFLLRCAGMVVHNVEHEAAEVRRQRCLRSQQPSPQELLDSIQGSADPILACDLSQQAWPVLCANEAAALLASLPQPLPKAMSFWSTFEVLPAMAGSTAYQQAAAAGRPFTLTCRLRPPAERPQGCSSEARPARTSDSQEEEGMQAPMCGPQSGFDLRRRLSAGDAEHAVLPASSATPSRELASVSEQRPQGAAEAAAAEAPRQLSLEPAERGQVAALQPRGSLDSALPALKRKPSAPDQVFAVAFAPCKPARLSAGRADAGAAEGGSPRPALWFATLRPWNLAATAAQARLGLLAGLNQPRQQGGSAHPVGTPPQHGSEGRARAATMPRVLLPENMQDVELGPLLGVGASGRTYVGRWQGSRVAVKCVELRGKEEAPQAVPHEVAGSDAGSMALVEAVLSKSLRHPHIVTTHAYGVRESGRNMGTCYTEVWIVQELCSLGSLLNAIERGRFKDPDGNARLLFAMLTAGEIAGALAFLHSKGVVHGDLSGHNVLLNPSTKDQRRFVAMVSDFGLARPLEVLTQLSTDTYGTISYMPAELVLHQRLSPAVDMYSFGVLLWEMLSGRRAWAGMSSLQILAAVTMGRRLEVPDGWPGRIQELVSRCLDKDPRQRPTAKEALQEIESILGPSRPEPQ